MDTPSRLQANEIRLGNLVYRTIEETETIALGLKDMSYFYECVADNGEVGNHYPIPLTEEWEHKLGFIDDKLIGNVFDFQFNGRIVLFLRGDWITLDHIKYVHQLQNLYFLLEGKELILKQK